MDINNKFEFAIPFLSGTEIWVTESTIAIWMIGALLIFFALIVRIKLKNFKDKPTGFQNVVELMVETMEDFTSSTIDSRFSYLGAWFFGVFVFIVVSNVSGLFMLRPPTSDLSVTVGFAITTFFLIHFLGIKKQKGKYFREYFEPMPLFFPIHLIGEIATPISLSFRLFGSILSGVIIIDLLYGMVPWFLKLGVPVPLNMFFDVFEAGLQAFIFTMLSMTFIKGKLGLEE